MSSPRLRTDFWIAALRRRAEASGTYVSVARRGAAEGGVVFVQIDRLDGTFDLYGPAPQSLFAEGASDRLFSRVGDAMPAEELRARIEREVRFDPDLWLIDIEDRHGRCFVDVVA